MIKEQQFIKPIKHSPDSKKHVEESNCSAIKIDDEDGLAQHLGFSSSILAKVDYFFQKDNLIQLIELSDMKENIDIYDLNFSEALKQAQARKGQKLKKSEEKKIKKQVWLPLICEFQQKWSGSIAIIERLYRKNERYQDDPSYQLLIVCKNDTDVRVLDTVVTFAKRLTGMMGTVPVCRTKDIQNYIKDKKEDCLEENKGVSRQRKE